MRRLLSIPATLPARACRPALLAMLLPALLVTACATPRARDYSAAELDPWERTNRRVYGLNKQIDRYALKPAATVYRTVVPKVGRRGINNALSNYGEPLNLVNALLQGKVSQAFRTLDRIIVNTTLGIGGVADVATDLGRPQESEDYGQTLAVWGVPSGPYLVLPLFGPSTVRDGGGLALDFAIDPSDISRNVLTNTTLLLRTGVLATRIVNLRDRVSEQGGDAFLADSLDEYVLVRSAFLQRRWDQIWDGNPPLADDEFDVPPEAPPEAPAPLPALAPASGPPTP